MPLPDNMELSTPQGKEWPLIPADVYQAEITDIEYKEIDNRWKQKPEDPDKKQVMNFEFTIIEEGPHYGRKLWQRMSPVKPYPPRQNGKETWVYRIATALAGHSITKAEADKFTSSDINGYIHRQVRITVSESAPNESGKRYNNIDGFLPAKGQLPPFDEKKVPKENQPAKTEATQGQPQSGLDKARAVAESLPRGNQAGTGQNLDVPENMPPVDIDVSDIPF